MGLMSLAAGAGSIVTLSANGHDEKEAVEELTKFIEDEN